MVDYNILNKLKEDLFNMEVLLPSAASPTYTCSDEEVVYGSHFGMKAEKGFDNTEALRNAIGFCLKNGKKKLIVEKGNYYFYEKTGSSGAKTSDIAAPPSSAIDPFVSVDGMDDFILDCSNSLFIFREPKPFIYIHNSRRILIKNLFIDWDWDVAPLASVGIVSDIANDGSSILCRFPEYPKVSDRMHFSIVGPFDPVKYSPGYKGGMEFRPYANNHIKPTGDEKRDAKMKQLVRELSDILTGKQEVENENCIRFYTKDSDFTLKHFHKGNAFNFRHFEYDMVTLLIDDSTHITADNVVIYSAPGSGFVVNGDSCYIHLKACKVTLRPGFVRSITTSVDCVHVTNSKGYFIIDDCEFQMAGDDCINIHDNSSMGIKVLSEHSLMALSVDRNAVRYENGFKVELRNPDLSPTGFCGTVEKAEYFPEDRSCRLTFKESLPTDLSEDTVLWNHRFDSANYIIRNCRFTNNRARGVLLQGSNGYLYNNHFENIQGAAIQIETGSESRWSEGHGVHNLIIEDNTIRHCDLNGWQMAVLYMGVYLPDGRTNVGVFDNILIKNNSIIDCPRLAMFLSSCRNVSVTGNAIINPLQIPLEENCYGSSGMEAPIFGESYHGVIQFEKASNCSQEDNKIVSFID